MDQNGKGEEIAHEEIINIVNCEYKSCVDCKTTKTPLWRSGPAGPKSLCNACGIRYRKKRAGMTQDLNTCQDKKKCNLAKDEKETTNKRRKVSEDLRIRVMALGKEVVVLQQQPRSSVKRQRRKSNEYWKNMGEVEQAAVLLMAMSCSSMFSLKI